MHRYTWEWPCEAGEHTHLCVNIRLKTHGCLNELYFWQVIIGRLGLVRDFYFFRWAGHLRDKMPLQAVIFRKDIWSPSDCLSYLRQHKLRPIKAVHETTNYYRYRITPPALYKKFFTTPGPAGVLFVIGAT